MTVEEAKANYSQIMAQHRHRDFHVDVINDIYQSTPDVCNMINTALEVGYAKGYRDSWRDWRKAHAQK